MKNYFKLYVTNLLAWTAQVFKQLQYKVDNINIESVW